MTHCWENSDWDLKCEFCKEPTAINPCIKCSNAMELSNLSNTITLPEFPGLTIVPNLKNLLYGEISRRSKFWEKTRIEFIKENPFCAWCKSITELNVHHIKPFHAWPELELKKTNLITLCENPLFNCHFVLGHLSNWKSYNPLIEKLVYFNNIKPKDKNDSLFIPGE